MASKYNKDIWVRGYLQLDTLPNAQGSVVTRDPLTNKLSTRTNAQILQDLGLSSVIKVGDNISLLSNNSNYTTLPIVQSWVSTQGYLTSFTETDPTVPVWVKAITQANITTWNGKQNALIAGANIQINPTTNTISATDTIYVLPTASATVLGGVKIGANLSIDANGILSAINTNVVQVLSGSGNTINLSGGGGSYTVPFTDWSNIPNKPTTFTPSVHNHPTSQINILTGYVLGSNLAISATDSLNSALGKIQAQINSKTSNGGTVTNVQTGAGLAGGPITNTGTISLNATTLASLALADTALQFESDPTVPTHVKGISTSDIAYWNAKLDSSALSGYVPTSRTITINGVAQDLSANRTWTIPDNDTVTRLRGTTSGTFTSGDLTLLAGAGIGVAQSGANFTLTNSAPNVQADWNATSGDAEILNKPNIPPQLVYTGSNGINVTGTVINPTYGATAGTVAQGNDSRFHNAVTLGTNQNGLGLSNQVLSLGLAGASSTGALSSAHWNLFNNKVSANNGTLTMTTGTGLSGGVTFGANQASNATFSVAIASGYTLPTNAQVNTWNGALQAVNLSLGTRTATTMPINNSGGTNVILPIVTTSLAGLMGAGEKMQLDTVASWGRGLRVDGNGVATGAGTWAGNIDLIRNASMYASSSASGKPFGITSDMTIVNFTSGNANIGGVNRYSGFDLGASVVDDRLMFRMENLASDKKDWYEIVHSGNISSMIGGNFVPYTGATANVNLGTRSITSTGGFIGNATTATTLATARTINGTSFNGSANIVTSYWGTARNITIGNKTLSVNGSGNYSWSLAEMGASSINHTHPISDIVGLQTELNKIGNLPSLTTTNKNNLVAAINEINGNTDNVKIGGRNLITNSTFENGIAGTDWKVVGTLTGGQVDPAGTLRAALLVVNNPNSYLLKTVKVFETPGEHTLTVWLKGTKAGNLKIWMQDQAFVKDCALTTSWQKFELVGNITNINTTYKFVFGGWSSWADTSLGVYIAFPKLEKGNKATDWSPAPEDQVSDWNETDSTKYSFIKNKPTIPTVNNGQLTLSTGTGLSGSATFTANQAGGSTFSVAVASTHKLPTITEWNALPTTNTVTRLRGTTGGTFTSGDLTLLAGAGIGVAQSGANITITNSSPNIVQTLGISGSTLSLSGGGGSVTLPTYTLPTASATVLGGIKVGSNLSINASGVLSATNTNTTYTSSNGILLTGTNFTPVYGTAANTIAQGNDSRINNGQTAFGWGNHSGLYALVGTSIVAGNGLSGGGTLAANRTITLGTPTAIGLSTTNAVTSSSHTHALDTATITAINNGQAAFNSLGNYLPLTGGTMTGIIDLNRYGNADTGLSWYRPTYKAWRTYMANVGTGPVGISAPQGQLATTWALRSYIESRNGYGWTFESGGAQSTTPTIVAEIRSLDGHARFGAVSVYGGTASGFLKANGTIDTSNYALVSSLSGYVPTSRTITINGQTFDLSANRSWTIATSTPNNGTLSLATGTGLSGSASFSANQAGNSTFTVGIASGYVLPTTAQVNSWNAKGNGTVTSVGMTIAGNALNTNTATINTSGIFGLTWGGTTAQYVRGDGSLATMPTGTAYTAGAGLTLAGTVFSLPVTVSGTGTFVQSVAQNANGITVTMGTPPNTTYATMSLAELQAGTVTAGRVISANVLGNWMNGVLAGYVPTSRTITINGVTQNLSANRSWNVSAPAAPAMQRYYDITDPSNNDYFEHPPITKTYRDFGFDVVAYNPDSDKFIGIFDEFGQPYLNEGIFGMIALLDPNTGKAVTKGSVECQGSTLSYLGSGTAYLYISYYRDTNSPTFLSGSLNVGNMQSMVSQIGGGSTEMFSGVIVLGIMTPHNTLMVDIREF